MKAHEVNISKLSEGIGVSTGLVSAWCRGEKKPGFNYILSLAEYFRVTTDFLLGVVDDAVPKSRIGDCSEQSLSFASRYDALDEEGKIVVANAIIQEERRIKGALCR